MKTQRDTPNEIAEKMVRHAVRHIDNMNYIVNILEPSAGTGAIADVLRKHFKLGRITCAELNHEKYMTLMGKGYDSMHIDFMQHVFHKKFDIIVAAPPFKNNVDVEHIQKMYSLLNDRGILVSLTTPYWTMNNETHQVAFREFLKGKEHSIEMLPDNTFMEKGKTVPTAIIKIIK